MSKVAPEVRFWAKVDAGGVCWEWTGARRKNGYGAFRVGGPSSTVLAHRFAYETLIGAIPPGRQLDHRCRNRGCVLPDHLEPVTQAENLRRGGSGSAINARKTHCIRGHSLADAYDTPGRKPNLRQRSCRTCARERYQAKKGTTR